MLHVHLKDVRAVGEPHETCRWGEGIVPIERCVRTLQRIGYAGAIAVEHEPETFDPTDDVRAMRAAARAVARVNVALVGAGNIAARYAACIAAQPRLAFAGATDLLAGRAAELVAEHGGRAYASLDDAARGRRGRRRRQPHGAVRARRGDGALPRGGQARAHREAARAARGRGAASSPSSAAGQGVRLSCAPATLLGEAQQTAWKLVRDGALGRVRAAYAEANWGRIERWHPGPESLYEVGAAGRRRPSTRSRSSPRCSGPARRVTAYATTTRSPSARGSTASRSRPSAPDFHVAVLELEDGVVARVTASFWVGARKQRGIELHGDEASLWMADFGHFDSRLERTEDGETYTPVPLPRAAVPRHRLGAPARRPRRGAGRGPAAPHGRRARGARGRGARRGACVVHRRRAGRAGLGLPAARAARLGALISRAARRGVDRLAGLEHGDELLQPARARLGLLRVLEPVEDRVAVAAVEAGEERGGRGARVELALQVVGHGDRAPGRRRRRPSGRRPSRARPRAGPPGACGPRRSARSTFSRLIFDHVLRARRGVKRWRKKSSSSLLRTASIQPKQSATSSASACVTVACFDDACARSSATPRRRRRGARRARSPSRPRSRTRCRRAAPPRATRPIPGRPRTRAVAC